MDPFLLHYAWLKVIAIFLSLFIMNMMIITVHELGHAIAYAVYTNSRVEIYLGSYGSNNTRKIVLGKFDFWVKPNLFTWNGGLCVPVSADNLSVKQRFNCILAGPVASLFLSFILIVAILVVKPTAIAAGFFTIFLVWSLLVFLYNIVPREKAIVMTNGSIIYNDGYKLRQIINNSRKESYSEIISYLNEGRHADALDMLDRIIDTGTKDVTIYRMAIDTHIKLKNYRKASQIQKIQIEKIGNLNTTDRVNLALLKTYLGHYNEAVTYYKHLLHKDGNNKYNLNNLGYTLNLMTQYEEAIGYLTLAINMDTAFAFAYSNRAYAKMQMGYWEDGRADNDTSLKINDKNAFAHQNAGLYYFEHKQYEDSLQAFEAAKSLDPDLTSIDRHITEAKWYVAQKKIL